jgi:hypothetical protein
MADKKVSQLTELTAPDGTEIFYCVKWWLDKKIKLSTFQNLYIWTTQPVVTIPTLWIDTTWGFNTVKYVMPDTLVYDVLDMSEVVQTTWNQSIAGTKTFSDINVELSWATGVFPLTIENLSTANVSTKYISLSVYWRDTVNTQKPVGSMVIAPVDWNWVNSYMALYTRTADVNTEKVRIDQLWNVWIWTTAPLNRLHVQSSTAWGAQMRVTETWDTTDAQYAWYWIYDNATLKWGIFKNWLSHDLSLWTTSKALTVLASNNNIWIWNAAPTEKLDVTGNIKSSGSIEALNTGGFKLGSSASIAFNTTTSSIDFIIN